MKMVNLKAKHLVLKACIRTAYADGISKELPGFEAGSSFFILKS